MEKIAAFCKAVPLMVVAVILLGVVTVPSANSTTHLPDCKANPTCLIDNSIDWKTVTAADIKAMINAGADVNVRDKWGFTPLDTAKAIKRLK